MLGLACTPPVAVEPPQATDVCRSDPSPHERAAAQPIGVEPDGGVIDLEAIRDIPVARSTEPWWTCELHRTTIRCERHEDCELVRSPCTCACARVTGASKAERRAAARALDERCAVAEPECSMCARPINAVACDAGVCVGVASVLNVVY